MGVYIPNMDKPKNCMDCIVEEYADCDVWKGVDSASNYKDSRYPKCPLIEIVTCGDCKYWHDHEWGSTCDKHIGHGFPSDYFCKDGERRSE